MKTSKLVNNEICTLYMALLPWVEHGKSGTQGDSEKFPNSGATTQSRRGSGDDVGDMDREGDGVRDGDGVVLGDADVVGDSDTLAVIDAEWLIEAVKD